ncbi:MAG TPA: 3'(2'),5'-bisphosphate nucleotidase CysQ [Polyangia bacterium]
MDLQRIHDAAVAAAKRAGAAIRGYYKAAYAVRDKGEDNPVTDADLAANRILDEALRPVDPDAGWLSEESVADPGWHTRPRAWIVDPLDGTREFTKGIPEFVVAVGYAVEGEARVGVLLNPVTGELFSGIVGVGAWIDGAPARPSTQAILPGARIVCSRSEVAKGLFEAYASKIEVVAVGSVAYKLGLVAAGRADASFTPRPRHAWDIAAGVAIVTAAGGRVTDRHGRPYRFNVAESLQDGVCATNGPLHDAVLALLAL